MSDLFLGVDGGQSHTEAVIADEHGNVLGRGTGGPSNHAEQPGGRERLRNAVIDSVGSALKSITGTAATHTEAVTETRFRSAHFGMTGGADFKEAVIGEIIRSDRLSVGHDAPSALFGATAAKPGVIVIAGTGSVVYADDGEGKTAQVGGLGYLFSDEGSGFWLAAQMIRLAIKESDGRISESGLSTTVLEYFQKPRLVDVANGFYSGLITRDEIAGLSQIGHEMAAAGHRSLLTEIENGTRHLSEGVLTAASRVGFSGEFLVSYCGGMFKGALIKQYLEKAIAECSTGAVVKEPVFGPAIGALLMAYKQVNIPIDTTIPLLQGK